MTRFCLALVQALVLAAVVVAAQAPADDEKLKKDLTAVIALNGQPCGEVVAVQVLGESDYAATCKDGNRYRVYVNKDGRVVVEKR
jgi:uncharacterized protein (DUF2147 family)